MKEASYLKIGELAQQTGLSVGNLRYYSDSGLLNPVKRGENGYRYYSSHAIQQVEFIKKAQALGFSLADIKQILDLGDRSETPCQLVKQLLDQKIEELELKIKQMTDFKAELEAYRSAWSNLKNPQLNPQEICPLIASVSLNSK
ncbi:MAG: heavy metal-responsive transcriptional regulator [Microcystaceae cyanobacterium]